MPEILVCVEITDDAVTDLSLQAVRRGAELARESGSKLSCLVLGAGIQAIAATLYGYGAEAVYAAEEPRLKSFLAAPYRKVVSAFVKKQAPSLIFFPATTRGDSLAPLVAHDLGMACALDCQRTEFVAGAFVAKRSEYDNKGFAKYGPSLKQGLIVTVKDGISDAGVPDTKKGNAEAVSVTLSEADFVTKVLKREVAKSTVDLKRAKIIVTAGAGIGTKDNYKLIENLATALGGEVGATRPVVDAGWASADRQIGQTGVTVKPDLYVACGVSGAVQHRVGMMNAKKIVAINTDASAPIFRFAHYKIVGDMVEVVPKLIKLLN